MSDKGGFLSIKRRTGQSVMINDEVLLIIGDVKGNWVQLIFKCDKSIPINRPERKIQEKKKP